MRLITAVLAFVLRKLGLLGALVLSLFVAYLLIQALVPTLREAVTDRERLQEVRAQRAALDKDIEQLEAEIEDAQREAVTTLEGTIDAEIDELTGQASDQEAATSNQRERRDDVCGFWESLPERLPIGPNPCEDATKLLEKAEEAQATVERNLREAEADARVLGDPELTNEQKLEELGADGTFTSSEREIDSKQSEREQVEAEERSLEEAQGSGVGWVVDQWARSWRWLAAIALLVLVMPPALRTVSYFVLMPMVHRAHRPIHLADGSEALHGELRTSPAERTLTIELGTDEVLSARSEHVRPVQGHVRSRVLYDWSSPFISYAAGLYGLTRVTGDESVTAATLSTPDDPDSYLMRIDFCDHPGLVMRPRHVVGVIGMPELQTRWRWGIQSLATWQVRYIMFSGTGSLIVQGSGDVVAVNPRGGTTRIEQHLMMGFDSRLTVGVNRTEVFLPYLWGRTPLVDDEFTGHDALFWQKSSADGPSNPLVKGFNAVFSAFGKLLGF